MATEKEIKEAYNIIGVSPNISDERLVGAYIEEKRFRKLDKDAGLPSAEEDTRKLDEAYKTICNERGLGVDKKIKYTTKYVDSKKTQNKKNKSNPLRKILQKSLKMTNAFLSKKSNNKQKDTPTAKGR